MAAAVLAALLPAGGSARSGATFKAALISDVGHFNDKSFNQSQLAGLNLAKGKQIIGVVGGIKIPPVDVFLAGYEAGAKKCVPSTTVLKGYSQDFVKQDLCKNVAENEIQGGAHVVFAVAGLCGLGALSAAK